MSESERRIVEKKPGGFEASSEEGSNYPVEFRLLEVLPLDAHRRESYDWRALRGLSQPAPEALS